MDLDSIHNDYQRHLPYLWNLPQIEMQLAATLAAQETARRIRTEVTQGYANELERLRTAAARGPRRSPLASRTGRVRLSDP